MLYKNTKYGIKALAFIALNSKESFLNFILQNKLFLSYTHAIPNISTTAPKTFAQRAFKMSLILA